MTAHLAPYLHLTDNRTAAAFEFYASVFGGEPKFMRAADMPMGEGIDPQAVMHAELHTPDGFHLYGTDMVQEGMPAPQAELAIMTDDAELGHRWYKALSEGGELFTPMERQEWGDEYANFADRFGQDWAINISTPKN
ncbi:VOC family protein [Mariniluteicoccus endophyticus]